MAGDGLVYGHKAALPRPPCPYAHAPRVSPCLASRAALPPFPRALSDSQGPHAVPAHEHTHAAPKVTAIQDLSGRGNAPTRRCQESPVLAAQRLDLPGRGWRLLELSRKPLAVRGRLLATPRVPGPPATAKGRSAPRTYLEPGALPAATVPRRRDSS